MTEDAVPAAGARLPITPTSRLSAPGSTVSPVTSASVSVLLTMICPNLVVSARFAPQGGNRQPVRFLIVRDEEKKRRLGDLYLEEWKGPYEAARAGVRTIRTPHGSERATWLGFANPARAHEAANRFAERFGEHPTIVVVCADLAAVHPSDADLDRLGIVGGASVYPMAHNL